MSANQQNVVSFVEMSIANARENISVMERVAAKLREMDEKVEKVAEIEAELTVLAREIRDENRLLPAEIDDLFHAVRDKSIEIVRGFSIDDSAEFKTTVGKTCRLIWRKLNKKFAVSKYIHIKRKDFNDAVDFINTFRLQDYL